MPHALDVDDRAPVRRLGPRSPSIPALALAVTLALVAAALLASSGPSPPTVPLSSTSAAQVPRASGASNTWTKLSPLTAPSPRQDPLLAFDSRSGRVILFGGWSTSPIGTVFNDTWSYDPAANQWTNRTPSTHPTIGCSVCFATAAMVYDSRANRVILFGASSNPGGQPKPTWAYDPDANTWTPMHPTSTPLAGHDFGIVYDVAADRVLLFGGGEIAPDMFDVGNNETWSYDYANDAWTRLAPAASPPSRFGGSMAYDLKADRTFLFGGCTNGDRLWPSCAEANDTWSYDYGANTWTNRSAAASPPPAVALPMVYDSLADRLILFGQGWATGNQTWSYNVTTNLWTAQHPTVSPPVRSYPGMTYDSVRTQTILFGGGGPTFLNDTWTYASLGISGGGRPTHPSEIPVVAWIGIGVVVVAAVAFTAVALWSVRRNRGGPPRGSP
ncbi:MAG TPA: kelch repeat-containing protein [Thermoplasmata archaeon]|nr:kelch repeat-containing protein [Thermoplasmata archaeon]